MGCRGSPVWVLLCPIAGKEVALSGPWAMDLAKLEARNRETMRRLLPSFLLKQIKSIYYIVNILRPRHRLFRFFQFAFIFSMCYFVCLSFYMDDRFCSMLGTTAFSLSVRAIELFLLKLGCSAGLSFVIRFALRAFLATEGAPVLGNMMSPTGGSGATWKEDTREIDILLESSWETEDTGSSVNQPVAPPANPVASPEEEAGPSNISPPAVPYPYQPDEVIGGDSVLSIQRRILSQYQEPSAHIIQQAEMDAEDLFEVKVDIIRQMASLDPNGDWLGRGARALDNPRTLTGEESLERLYSLLSDLETEGVNSEAFSRLKEKMPLRRSVEAEHSTT